jgi:hypothetical protein
LKPKRADLWWVGAFENTEMSDYQQNDSKDAGEEKIRERVKSSAHVYADEFEPFLGFTSIKAIQDKLEEFKQKAASDISKFYAQQFLEAAGALEEKDPGAFIRLRNNILKPRGVAITTWERTVHEIQYREHQRIAQAAKDAKAATFTQPRPGSGQKLNLADPVPCDTPVDGAELANEIAKIIEQFVVVGEHEVYAIVLWIFFTHLIDVFDIAPRLAITSPVKRCGKTTLIKLLRQLVARALACSNISPAAIFRTIERAAPTLLMDEMDTYLGSRNGPNNPAAEELRGILNSGHDRATAFVIRLVLVGDDYEPRQFSTFTPIVHALIGALPGTLRDRSIPIGMKRKRPNQKVEKFGRAKKRNAAMFESLRSRIARWCRDHRDIVASAEPLLPNELLEDGADERAGDHWQVLLAIADALGGNWPQRARVAAVTLSGKSVDDGVAVTLLRDIRDIFNKDNLDRIASRTICERLGDIEGSPWATYGKPPKPTISQNQLARLLRPFQIEPKTIRLPDDPTKTAKGYERKDLEDAWARYLPTDPSMSPDVSASPDLDRHNGTTAGGVGESDDFRSDTERPCDVSKGGTSPYGRKDCDGVADQNRESESAEGETGATRPHAGGPDGAADDPGRDGADASANGMPFTMMEWMKRCLRHLGRSAEEIFRMTPKEARATITARLHDLGYHDIEIDHMRPDQKEGAIFAGGERFGGADPDGDLDEYGISKSK